MKSVKGKILLGMVATIVMGMLVIGIVSIAMSLQSSNSMLQTAMQGTAEIAATVSYTHLDVYKRQRIYSRGTSALGGTDFPCLSIAFQSGD